MSKAIKPEQLGDAINKELTLYHENIVERLNDASKRAVKKMVKLTKRTAPVNTGEFKKSIASKLYTKSPGGDTYAWYVKAPHYRLTHLLVHGHVTPKGGRTKADPFLKNASETVITEYQKEVEEALKQ